MRGALVAGFVLGAALGGCGGGSGEGDVKDAARSFLDAVRARDGKRACAALTANGQAIYTQLGDLPCEQGITQAALPPRAKIGAVAVKGDTATVSLTDPEGVVIHFVMKKQGGSWKVDSTG
jgi:hypothetical protein